MLDSLLAWIKALLRINAGTTPIEVVTSYAASTTPQARDDFFRQANASAGQGDFVSAQAFYEKTLAVSPSDAAGYIGLGFALLQTGQLVRATRVLKTATVLNPLSADGFYMLGKAYAEQDAVDLADKAWHQSLKLSKSIESIYCDYCLLLFNLGESGRAWQVISQGVEAFPENADINFYLGNLCLGGGDLEAALSAYCKSVTLNENAPFALSNYGTALRQAGRLDESLAVTTKALALAPDAHTIFSNYLLGIQYSSKFSKQDRFEAHSAFADRFEKPLVSSWGTYSNSLVANRKIRLGYVSGDFRNHSLVFFIEPILRNHNRLNFEIYCYYAYPVNDAATNRLIALADHWLNCSQMSDDELAHHIRGDAIDVLIDLSGHTGYNRLLTFARKPAPVQLTWLGYQATTGLKAMDFRITDEALDPLGTSEQFHSERLLRLVASGTFSPAHDSPPVSALPSLLGRPFTFGCLNNPSKITDQAVAIWSEILRRSTQARLLIGNSTPELQRKLTSDFVLLGIDSERLIFRPKVSLVDYLTMHGEIDLALDTFPYNGGTTTFHSLWMGVPIMAIKGDTSLANVGTSIMQGLGLGQFCAETADSYIDQAVYFSMNPHVLSEVRSSLRVRMTDMTQSLTIAVTDSLETSLQRCWSDYCGTKHATLAAYAL